MKIQTPLTMILFLLVSPALHAEVPFTEIQWSICEPSTEALKNKLHVDLPEPENRSVYFLETKNMDLAKHSAFLRIRVGTNGKIKSSAKVNYPDAQNLPWDLLDGKSSKCEWDVYGANKKVGCSLENKANQFKKSLSDKQEEYLEKATGFTDFADLLTLGPVASQAWTWSDQDLGMNVDLETISGPKDSFLIEISSRVPTKDTAAAVARFNTWIQARGLTLCPQQQGLAKTLIPALLQEQNP